MQVLAALSLAACCCCFVLAMPTQEAANSEKEKRGIAAFTAPKAYASGSAASGAEVAYATAKVSPQTFAPSPKDFSAPPPQQQQYIKYVSQQQTSSVPYQYEYDPQPQPQQQQISKVVPAKIAFAQSAAQNPVHFSLASDVSSFSYSSPLVSYSNLGLLKQTIGKIAEASNSGHEGQYTQPQQPQQQYTSDSKIAYAPPQPQKVVLQEAPTPQKLSYVASGPVQKLQYAHTPQRLVYARPAPAQLQHSAQQYKTVPQIVYASSPEEAYEKVYGKAYDRINYVPQQNTYEEPPQQHQITAQQQHQPVYQAQPQQQVQYIKLSPQQLAAYAQQLQQQQAQHVQPQQQQQYHDAQTEQQPIYAVPQYYQSKYANAGVTYQQQH